MSANTPTGSCHWRHTASRRRWDIARRLISDDTLDPVDRVAGALVVLYAQPLARVVTLTTADIIDHDGRTNCGSGQTRPT